MGDLPSDPPSYRQPAPLPHFRLLLTACYAEDLLSPSLALGVFLRVFELQSFVCFSFGVVTTPTFRRRRAVPMTATSPVCFFPSFDLAPPRTFAFSLRPSQITRFAGFTYLRGVCVRRPPAASAVLGKSFILSFHPDGPNGEP